MDNKMKFKARKVAKALSYQEKHKGDFSGRSSTTSTPREASSSGVLADNIILKSPRQSAEDANMKIVKTISNDDEDNSHQPMVPYGGNGLNANELG